MANSLELGREIRLLDDQRLGRKEPNILIGVDYHPSFQQIAILVKETGAYSEPRLNHSDGEAEKFYRDLQLRGVQVRVGMEATGYSRWFERLLAALGVEVWIGDPAEIKARRVKKQKDRLSGARQIHDAATRSERALMPNPISLSSPFVFLVKVDLC